MHVWVINFIKYLVSVIYNDFGKRERYISSCRLILPFSRVPILKKNLSNKNLICSIGHCSSN